MVSPLYLLTTIISATASADATVATATTTRTMIRSRSWTLKTPNYGYFWDLWSECEVSWGSGKLSASRITWHCHWLHDSIESRFFVFQSEMINLQTSISGCGRRTALCHPRRPPPRSGLLEEVSYKFNTYNYSSAMTNDNKRKPFQAVQKRPGCFQLKNEEWRWNGEASRISEYLLV